MKAQGPTGESAWPTRHAADAAGSSAPFVHLVLDRQDAMALMLALEHSKDLNTGRAATLRDWLAGQFVHHARAVDAELVAIAERLSVHENEERARADTSGNGDFRRGTASGLAWASRIVRGEVGK